MFLSPQRWMKTVNQQVALQELQTWVDSAETRLEELRTRSSPTEPSQHLKDCRVIRTDGLRRNPRHFQMLHFPRLLLRIFKRR